MGPLSRILQTRSPVLCIEDPRQSVAAAAMRMAELEIGAVPVCDGGRLVGIFSERDFLRRVAALGLDPETTALAEVMTRDPVTAAPTEDRVTAIRKMQAIGCRHLPIVVEGELIDMLSMRDLLFVEILEKEAEVEQLRQYINGTY